MFVFLFVILAGAFAASAPIEIMTDVNIYALGFEHYAALLGALS